MDGKSGRFASWLNLTMERRGLSQADLARVVGVADAQVSRWRRGQVIPTVRSLQRIADTFGVPRATLDSLAGYPTGERPGEPGDEGDDPTLLAELQIYGAWYRQLLEQQVPRSLWRVYAESCAALAQAMGASWRTALDEARHADEADTAEEREAPARKGDQDIGFRSTRPESGRDREG